MEVLLVEDHSLHRLLVCTLLEDKGFTVRQAGSAEEALRPDTARAAGPDPDGCLLAGCDGYVTKPIDTRTLPQYLTGLLESFRRRRE